MHTKPISLREYAKQTGQTEQNAPSNPPASDAVRADTQSESTTPSTAQSDRAIALAKNIITEYQVNREAAQACCTHLLKGIREKQNPYLLLLAAAEAIGRATGQGDGFYLQVDSLLQEVHGRDITHDTYLTA